MADDKPALDPKTAAQHREIFRAAIRLIQISSIANTNRGKQIITQLIGMNAKDNICFAPLETRGDWTGELIRVSDNYAAKVFIVACELVHEGAHALWRQKNPDKVQSPADVITEEEDAQKIQLQFYAWLRKKMNAPVDEELEKRLKASQPRN